MILQPSSDEEYNKRMNERNYIFTEARTNTIKKNT